MLLLPLLLGIKNLFLFFKVMIKLYSGRSSGMSLKNRYLQRRVARLTELAFVLSGLAAANWL